MAWYAISLSYPFLRSAFNSKDKGNVRTESKNLWFTRCHMLQFLDWNFWNKNHLLLVVMQHLLLESQTSISVESGGKKSCKKEILPEASAVVLWDQKGSTADPSEWEPSRRLLVPVKLKQSRIKNTAKDEGRQWKKCSEGKRGWY